MNINNIKIDLNNNKINYLDIIIDGKNINTKNDLFEIFEINLLFPSYFGKNWDALWDILSNKNYKFRGKIFINLKNTDLFFNGDEDLLNVFLELIKDISELDDFYIVY